MSQTSRKHEPGRLPSLGQDHAQGHKTYVENLTEGGRLWLRTKPFHAPPTDELTLCLRTYAHIIEQLSLGLGAQVLDVGCGPGWMSEFLARCGYWVTGIDISEDMVEIARSRVESIERPIGDGVDEPGPSSTPCRCASCRGATDSTPPSSTTRCTTSTMSWRR